ncbi:DMT family transporter [Ancylobacter rudongensis]|uniref:EamA-like transporter family protein n=1 Tax=Ancylobacter rudongensis TaxID=177413 RepID=A0A1G4TLZ6_9HYPH|nr:DMT family transporter [Ancylobacter rudongensis]SCW82371.1 EamA-like transporter family protein [Ancylobacter rudongensis]
MSPPPAAVIEPSLGVLPDAAPSVIRDTQLRRQAFLAVIMAAMCIGFSAPLVRLADAGPAAIGFWRLFFALGPAMVWAYAEHRALVRHARRAGVTALRPSLRQVLLAMLAGLFFGADLIVFHKGLALTSTANALLLGNLAVVFVFVFGWLILRERPTRGLLIALVLALTGTLIIIGSSALGGGQAGSRPVSVTGDVLCVGAALAYASYMLATRAVRRAGRGDAVPLGGGMVSLVASATGALVCLGWAVASGETLIPQSLQGLLAVIGLGLIAHATGQGLATFALGRLPAGVISVVLLLQIVVGTTLAALLFGEFPSLVVLLGGLLVVAGVTTARPN